MTGISKSTVNRILQKFYREDDKDIDAHKVRDVERKIDKETETDTTGQGRDRTAGHSNAVQADEVESVTDTDQNHFSLVAKAQDSALDEYEETEEEKMWFAELTPEDKSLLASDEELPF